MTVQAWQDVPPGTSAHHHCLATVEWSTDLKYWTDASRTAPGLVAWQPSQVTEWARNELVQHYDQAEETHGRQDWIGYAMQSRAFWERLDSRLGDGRWTMLPFHLTFQHILVLQVLVYADTACPDHTRP